MSARTDDPRGIWLVRLFLLPYMLAGIFLIALCLKAPFLWVFGTDAPGRITKLYTYHSHGKHADLEHCVRYVYTVNDVEYTGNYLVDGHTYASLSVGQDYPIRAFGPAPIIKQPSASSDFGMLCLLPFIILWISIVFTGLLPNGQQPAGDQRRANSDPVDGCKCD